MRVMGLRRLLPALCAVLLSTAPEGGHTQHSPSAGPFSIRALPYPSVDDEHVDRARTEQLTDSASTAGFLLRSPSSMNDRAGAPFAIDLYLPRVRTLWLSDIPSTLHRTSSWTGRGANLDFGAGLGLRAGPLSLTVAPELSYAANGHIGVLQLNPYYPEELYPPFYPAWYREDVTIDLPLRPGEESVLRVRPGQSAAAVTAGPLTFGAGTENQWWGPGIRNAIVLSANAPGFPHAFLRTSHPIRTPIGEVDARWIAGRLRTADGYRPDSEPQRQGIGAFAVTLTPRWEPDLTIGIARSRYGLLKEGETVLGYGAGALFRWNPRGAQAPDDPVRDQVFSAFGRWVFPDVGAEVYAEWARRELPSSFRDLLIHANHSQGYTLGLQWARPALSGFVRLQGEITNLEMSTTFRTGRTTSYYVSYAGEPGYTHEGKVLGASIGPGASSQWLALDYLAPAATIGLFGGRVRWDNDAFYTFELAHLWGVPYHSHDVSVFGGLRTGIDLPGLRVNAEFMTEKRMNYLFQNWSVDWGSAPIDAVDVVNRSLRLSLSPRFGPR